MIKSIKHKGLRRLFERGDASKVRADQARRIAAFLADLDEVNTLRDLDGSRYHLHPLSGDRMGYWSARISANWRIVFRFEDGDACDVDLVDYH